MNKRELMKKKMKDIQSFTERVNDAASALYKVAIAHEPKGPFTIKEASDFTADCQVILVDLGGGPKFTTPGGMTGTSPQPDSVKKVLMFKGNPIPLFSTEENGRQFFCEKLLKLCKTKEDLLKVQKAAYTII